MADSTSFDGAAGAGVEPARLPDEASLFEEFERDKRAGQTAREFLTTVREELSRRHFAGAGGAEIVYAFTAAIDDLMRALYRHADAIYGRRYPRFNQRIGVVARGGYGRGELNPYSDIDLLFLHVYKPGPYAEIVTEIILHALWDAGLVVGYGVRNVPDTVRLAMRDFKEQTAILDARFLAGDEPLYADLQKSLDDQVLGRNQQKFFQAKLKESRERHLNLGDSIYLLEPHIKDGEGGLRDLQTAMWLAKVKYRAGSLSDLVQKAVISGAELKQVEGARDFLWRVRNSLHFLSRHHTDQLTFEYQERIAPMLGFAPEGELTAGAMLMRTYYQHASTVHLFSEGLIARVTGDPSHGFFSLSRGRRIRPGVLIRQQLLSVAERDFFKDDPINLITVFADCQAQEVQLAGSTYQFVRDNLDLIDDKVRRDPRAGAALMQILGGRHGVADTLEAMHRAGVLGAIIPEFGSLYARVLHDLYHIYTVDRHSLRAVRELEVLRAGQFKETNPLLTEVARELDFMPLVFLALLLHDIGKGQGHDHHERGAQLTTDVCRRLGLDGDQTDLVVFLVRSHLTMSQVSQKGDVDDQVIVEDFARSTGSIDRLKALYLLTYADMKAVAPNVYNNWRDMLLSELYLRALKVLEQGDREAVDPARRLASAKAAARQALERSGAKSADVDEFLRLMPDRYFLTAPETDLRLHFDLIRAAHELPLVCRHRHFPELEFSEFIVVTRDQAGLFSKIAGVLTANNLNILSARITTATDGTVLDVFRVSHLGGADVIVMDDERWLRVERDLEHVLAGDQSIEELISGAHHVILAAKKFVRRVPTEVTVDNRTSEEFTVVDVFTQDRVGLLFDVTNTLFKLGLVIHLARISTNADQALDVFYVTDQEERKITDLARMRELRLRLLETAEEIAGA